VAGLLLLLGCVLAASIMARCKTKSARYFSFSPFFRKVEILFRFLSDSITIYQNFALEKVKWHKAIFQKAENSSTEPYREDFEQLSKLVNDRFLLNHIKSASRNIK